MYTHSNENLMEKWQTELLITQDINIFKKHAIKSDREGNNFTHFAARTGNVHLIQHLKEWNESWFAKSIMQGCSIILWAIYSKKEKMLDFFYQYEPSLFTHTPQFINLIAELSWTEGIKWFCLHVPGLLRDNYGQPSLLKSVLAFINVETLNWMSIHAPAIIKQQNHYSPSILVLKALELARIDILKWVEQNEQKLQLLHKSKSHSIDLYRAAWNSGSISMVDFVHYYFGASSLVIDKEFTTGCALNSGVPAQVNYALHFFPKSNEIEIDSMLSLSSEKKKAHRIITLNKLLDNNFTLIRFSERYYGDLKKDFNPEINKKLACNLAWPQNYALNMKKAFILYAGCTFSNEKNALIYIGYLLLLMSIPFPYLFNWQGFFNQTDRFILPEQRKPYVLSAFN